jgi:hypothetical protein
MLKFPKTEKVGLIIAKISVESIFLTRLFKESAKIRLSLNNR